ncbi:hypothetical protein [Xylella fastidiosa]|uniref:hypothetical protein n=1 Tax=Xylella fastidiosa TaxID=2371 RepID=UPI0007078C4E|nr:hypothetical protein [Xylella fastidiosa]KQH72807.1 phage antirepressor protein [Xylella fastidiosa]
MTQLPAAVCFSGKSLSIIDRDGVPHLTAADLAHALGYKDTVSLTHIRRCGTVASKELQNSCSGGIRTRQLADFLYPYVFMSGGQQRYKTRKGKAVRRNYCAVLNLPTPTGVARQNVSRSLISAVGDVL